MLKPSTATVPWSTMPAPLARLAGDEARGAAWKTRLVRGLIVVNVVLATRYVTWRVGHSIHWAHWPFALALLGAELFSYVDLLLFALTTWRVRSRGEPPPPPSHATVDVFVTTYDEPVAIVRETATAALAITYPHATWILDDGNRDAMRQLAEEIGCGYIVRSDKWVGKARHAKAGNLINALAQTSGEFILQLDADMVPRPHILHRLLGWFQDPDLAFVQSPQIFKNTPKGDPFGTDAPLFYGPIQAGKDGWNSAFFCGSNAVLRREALMQVGIVHYARDIERSVPRRLARTEARLRRSRRLLPAGTRPHMRRALEDLLDHVRVARAALRRGRSVQQVTWDFQRRVEHLSRQVVAGDLAAIRDQIRQLTGTDPLGPADAMLAVRALAAKGHTPLAALTEQVAGIDLDRAEEAEVLLPMATISVTEDMATAMRMHALGWTSLYHHELLADGLAPEDLETALTQRLRWAQGTLQILFRENPLCQRGLSVPQRLLYLATMWSYFSGFPTVVYLTSPVLCLLFGLMPVQAYSTEFFAHFLPFLVANQLFFLVIGWGMSTWRGQQYSLALFPLWIRAVTTAAGNVFLGRTLGFAVTPKDRKATGTRFDLVRPQLVAMGALALSIPIGFARLWWDATTDVATIVVNALWALYSLALLSVVIRAATWRAPATETASGGTSQAAPV